MHKDTDDQPSVNASGKGLGVRVTAVNGVVDVELDEHGRVILNGKGMSVAPHWTSLPYFLIPKRLVRLFPAARGSEKLVCFTMGQGEFVSAEIAQNLALHVDSGTHGVVAPRTLVTADRFQHDLAATRDEWKIDEELP